MAAQVNWRESFDAAQQEAKAAYKPVLLEFYMDTCPHCMKLHQETLTDAAVIEAVNARFIPVRLEGRQHMDLVQQFNVRGAPTTLIFAPEGKELHRFAGFLPPAEYLAELDKA